MQAVSPVPFRHASPPVSTPKEGRVSIANSSRGVALLLVLTMIVLITVLVVGILVTARQEAATTQAYSAGSDVRLLSETAVNLVKAQIAQATQQEMEAGKPLAWISQPGLIRTFSPTGQQKAYKLYSSYSMVGGDDYNPAAISTMNAEVPQDWHQKPEEFVDLNRPVELHIAGGNRKIFPVVDPTAASSQLVEGFSYEAGDYVAPPSADPSPNPLPMPVRWLYVTPSGEFVDASDPKKKTATARIAFWTDDDSSKVNVNTASGGVFFDTPVANWKEEHMLGRTQPIAQEYQRWPGHPSTTSLTPVLKPLRDISNVVERAEAASLFTPRIGWGGSKGASEQAWITRSLGSTDLNRLFASVDEIVFEEGMTGAERETTKMGNADLAKEETDRLRFFMTSHSRAPELNLFNRPRISLWPFNEEMVSVNANADEKAKLTPEDKLIRFASELGGLQGDGGLDYSKRKRFYFQRKSAWDPSSDWTNIPDNRALFSYLQDLTSQSFPSASASRSGDKSFLDKFGQTGRDQNLTLMWDYIRSNINSVNQSYQPVGFTPYSFPQGHDTQKSGFNDIAPLLIPATGTKGLGRYPGLVQVILQFYNAGESLENVDLRNNMTMAPGADELKDYVIRKVRMVVLLQFEAPLESLYGSNARFQVKMKAGGLQTFSFFTDPSNPRVVTAVSNSSAPGQPMNPNLPEPILVRNPTAGITGWTTDLGNDGIGFPARDSDQNRRTTNYVDAFAGRSLDMVMNFYRVMTSPIRNSAKVDNGNPENDHEFKVLANRQALTSDDLAQLAKFDSNGREDVYYPFVSDIIEFRLPNRPPPLEVSMTPAQKEAIKQLVSPRNLENAKDPRDTTGPTRGTDYFEALFAGATLQIEIYPGLRDGVSSLSPIASNWSVQSAGNKLLEARIDIGDTIIPLPRLGPPVMTTFGGNIWASSQQKLLSALAEYYKRAEARVADYLMLVPRITGNPAALRYQMDVFRSYALSSSSPINGDIRLAVLSDDLGLSSWEPHPQYRVRGVFHGANYFARDMKTVGSKLDTREENRFVARSGDTLDSNMDNVRKRQALMLPTITEYGFGGEEIASPSMKGAKRNGSAVGDFSNGYGLRNDGGYAVGPDLGSAVMTNVNAGALDSQSQSSPYIAGGISRAGVSDDMSVNEQTHHKNFTGLMFSPFKQAPSPVIFGTLPSRAGNMANPGSWETLLFCPNPAGGRSSHRGWDAPRDHFWLDLFYMPVSEPYAITENFATAGKINLNYQIAPFNYIQRKTGMHALLEEMTRRAAPSFKTKEGTTIPAQGSIVAIPTTEAATGTAASAPLNNPNSGSPTLSEATEDRSYRKFVDAEKTLDLFDERFKNNDPFVSASEICEMFLVPEGVNASESALESFWNGQLMTGDDRREMPYNHLFPRVTTRSNTFTVHFWVQTLAPRPGAGSQSKSVVTGEYRGSTTIERYLDPNLAEYGATISDGGNPKSMFPSLHDKYLFRDIEHRHFSP